MKTTSTILCLLFSVALTAQVTNLPTVLQVNDEGENAFSVVPKQLSYDGSNRVYIRTADDQIAIYDTCSASWQLRCARGMHYPLIWNLRSCCTPWRHL